jgi:hypothetical protein
MRTGGLAFLLFPGVFLRASPWPIHPDFGTNTDHGGLHPLGDLDEYTLDFTKSGPTHRGALSAGHQETKENK